MRPGEPGRSRSRLDGEQRRWELPHGPRTAPTTRSQATPKRWAPDRADRAHPCPESSHRHPPASPARGKPPTPRCGQQSGQKKLVGMTMDALLAAEMEWKQEQLS
ncbi:hypothetical protein WISP_28491 [Willisornis vidua]|uniref:Uncharacterized protein n=1 Tax=Willisornis vidua TaxID=1566151 RepID=A0ABQ9DRH2_9PASS|nr:hypothetical protein WISP_28491 [Willisornis vidua]